MTPDHLRSNKTGSFHRKAAVAAVIAAAIMTLGVEPGAAQQVSGSGVSGRLVSASARPLPGASELMYTAPARAGFMLTQACVEHPGLFVQTEKGRTRLTYGNRGCTNFEPAVSLPTGERLRCVNNSGEQRTCSISGVLGAAPEPHTAQIIDVES